MYYIYMFNVLILYIYTLLLLLYSFVKINDHRTLYCVLLLLSWPVQPVTSVPQGLYIDDFIKWKMIIIGILSATEMAMSFHRPLCIHDYFFVDTLMYCSRNGVAKNSHATCFIMSV